MTGFESKCTTQQKGIVTTNQRVITKIAARLPQMLCSGDMRGSLGNTRLGVRSLFLFRRARDLFARSICLPPFPSLVYAVATLSVSSYCACNQPCFVPLNDLLSRLSLPSFLTVTYSLLRLPPFFPTTTTYLPPPPMPKSA